MRIKTAVIFICVIFSFSCQKSLEELDKYKRPDWLFGSLFKQIENQDDLNLFRECLEKTIYDSIIDISGSYTVFAPTDEIFSSYLSSRQYNSIDDIPHDELLELIESHIIQNAWTLDQIRSINTDGWIDDKITNNNSQVFVPRAFKKQTLFREKNNKYWVKSNLFNEYSIVNQQNSTAYRTVFTSSRKYMPFFFSKYFDTYNLSYTDYEFYFNRPFNLNDMYYGEAKIISSEIPAENGYLYKIDKVIEPLPNGAELLKSGHDNISYTKFLNLINEFPVFTVNIDETNKQPGAKEGKVVETLYNMTFPGLLFNVYSEISGPNQNLELNSIQYHSSLLAPTDPAFDKFIAEYISIPNGWGNLTNLPSQVKNMIVNSYMASKPVFKSDFKGFVNGAGDSTTISESSIVQNEFGSNCTFIGLNEAIIPKAFSSVSSQIYLNSGYSFYMYAIEGTKVISALKSDGDYSLYAISNLDFGVDSSLFINFNASGQVSFTLYDRGVFRMRPISSNELRLMILNHVGNTVPTGIASKEFIENLAGNYIIIDNINNLVSGTNETTFGYNGDSIIFVNPNILGNRRENGQAFNINTWLSFGQASLYSVIAARKKFFDLAVKAGLVNTNEYKFNFFSEEAYNTVFIPSDSALDAYNAHLLPIAELKKFIQYHFVPGELLFTDGKKPAKYYETRCNELTPSGNVQRKLYIQPTPDNLKILDSQGILYLNIPQRSNTNIISTIDADEASASPYDNMATGVIHNIDKVLIRDLLDTGK